MFTKPILVLGSINIDLVSRVDRFPAPGETIAGGDLRQVSGGKGANQAVAIARLGGQVAMIGKVGDDAFGEPLRAQLAGEGVDVAMVAVCSGVSTGSALILVDSAGRNSIVVCPGANGRLNADDLPSHIELQQYACVVAQLEVPVQVVVELARRCREAGVPFILDPAPVPVGGLPEELYTVDLLTPNRTEALQLVGRKPGDEVDPEVLAWQLHERGPHVVVIKLDKDGAVIADGEGVRSIPPFHAKVVDTTAAGDAFTAALVVAWSEGRTLKESVTIANAAGALCCERFGAQPSLPGRQSVERLAFGQLASQP